MLAFLNTLKIHFRNMSFLCWSYALNIAARIRSPILQPLLGWGCSPSLLPSNVPKLLVHPRDSSFILLQADIYKDNLSIDYSDFLLNGTVKCPLHSGIIYAWFQNISSRKIQHFLPKSPERKFPVNGQLLISQKNLRKLSSSGN